MRLIMFLWCMLYTVFLSAASVGEQLQSASVTVATSSGSGSGAIVLRTPEGEPEIAFVLTAAHVVESCRQVRDIVTVDGTSKKAITYEDVAVRQDKIEDGRTVGELRLQCRVLNVDNRRDVALLMVRAKGLFSTGVSFYLDAPIPAVGTSVYHCGSPAGQMNAASLTGGIIAQVGRRIPDFVGDENGYYDQIDAATRPGSSGGIIALQADGRYIGMLTVGLTGSDSFGYMTPIRLIRDWAREVKAEWVLDSKQKAPAREQILKMPIESTPPELAPRAAKPLVAPGATHDMPYWR